MVLRIGRKAPEFALFDAEGREIRLSELLRNGVATIAFFPFAFSAISDRELCMLRDSLAGGWSTGSTVGISVDSVFTLKIAAETYNLGFPLLSDFNKDTIKAYQVLQDSWVEFRYRGVAKRSVFIVDGKGILRYRWVSDDPAKEPPYEEVLGVVRKLG